jgi:hypothetical protein
MSVFRIIVVRQITERVWVEIRDVETAEAAITAYKEGEGREVHHKLLSTETAEIEEVYQERSSPPQNGYTNGAAHFGPPKLEEE